MNASNNPMVVVLADDDEDDRALTIDALRNSKPIKDLRTVNDGEDLMDYLNHRGRHSPPALSPRPGLVLLDLNMPRKNGLEVLREIRADPALRSIPVVVFSTSKAKEDVDLTYCLGANSFIVKPVRFEELVKSLSVTAEYWFRVVQLPGGSNAN